GYVPPSLALPTLKVPRVGLREKGERAARPGMKGRGSEIAKARRTQNAEIPATALSMGGTLRGRFELPRALRPTRSQVWRVRPGFATSAASPLPESGNTLSRSVARGP